MKLKCLFRLCDWCQSPEPAGSQQGTHSPPFVHGSSSLCAHPQHVWEKVHQLGVPSFFCLSKKRKSVELDESKKTPHIIRLCIPTPSEGRSRAGTCSIPQPQAAPVTPCAHGQRHLTRFLLRVEQNLLRGDTSADPGYKGWPVLACGQQERDFSFSFHVT